MAKKAEKSGKDVEVWRQRLRQAIDDRGLDYQAVAEGAGFNKEYVSKMLNGRINPTVDKILRICDFAGIEASFLFVSETASQQVRDVVKDAANLPEEDASLVARLIESARKS